VSAHIIQKKLRVETILDRLHTSNIEKRCANCRDNRRCDESSFHRNINRRFLNIEASIPTIRIPPLGAIRKGILNYESLQVQWLKNNRTCDEKTPGSILAVGTLPAAIKTKQTPAFHRKINRHFRNIKASIPPIRSYDPTQLLEMPSFLPWRRCRLHPI